MVFRQPDGLGVALYIQRKALLDSGIKELAREDACRLARIELEKAGYADEDFAHVEAFENCEGWLVFAASATKEKNSYFHFTNADHYLDAVNNAVSVFSEAWCLEDGSVVAKLRGVPEALRRASYRLSEYGRELENPELLLRHVSEIHS